MGDRSIQGRAGEGFGGMHVDAIDANSRQTEQYTEARTLGGAKVFVSPESAQKIDLELAGGNRDWTVHASGNTWQRLKAAIDELRR
jgi:hypothetical protein